MQNHDETEMKQPSGPESLLPTSRRLTVRTALSNLVGAIAFYTCLPIPQSWPMAFDHTARFAPVVGLLIGGLLCLLDLGLTQVGMPIVTRSAVVVVAWVGLTGGLHLDGAMDTADGLAVMDRPRRLDVMADSATGAFGAMAGIALLLLKTVALADIDTMRWFVMLAAAGWGRWGQQVAIARYPYLKPTGKGAFHKRSIRSWTDTLPCLGLLVGVSLLPLGMAAPDWRVSLGAGVGGMAIAVLTAAWFNRQLGGHTGDTYGAVVEWTESLLLLVFTILVI